MTLVPSPPVQRPAEGFAERTRSLLRLYLGLQPDAPVPGEPFVAIFAHIADVVADHVDRVPDWNLLAFLELVGVRPNPPQPARAPVTFELATGTVVDALVPAGTLLAAVPEPGDVAPVVFETERDLVATPVTLTHALAREPAHDRFSDATSVAAGASEGTFAAFSGDRSPAHRLYLGGYDALLGFEGLKGIRLEPAETGARRAWLAAVQWSRWDGSAWVPLESTADDLSGAAHLSAVQASVRTSIEGRTSSWLRGELSTNVPRNGLVVDAAGVATLAPDKLLPDAVLAAEQQVDPRRPFEPFGPEPQPGSFFHVASFEAFSKPGAGVQLDVVVASGRTPNPSSDLVLLWEVSTDPDLGDWVFFGASGQVQLGITDTTASFTVDGTITFEVPPHWGTQRAAGVEAHWLRARIFTGNYGLSAPQIERLSLRYVWALPRITDFRAEGDLERTQLPLDAALTNQTAVDASKDFLPFGQEPRVGDTLYLASDDALTVPAGATVWLHVALTNPGSSGLPPPAAPSSDLTLRWECWDASARVWKILGESTKSGSTPSGFVDGTNAFTSDGNVQLTLPVAPQPIEVNAQLHRWLRVRIVKGNYGGQAVYTPIDPNDLARGYKLSKPTLAPPSIGSLLISSAMTFASSSLAVVTENDFELVTHAAGQPYNPFIPPRESDPALLLGFDRPFSNVAHTLFLDVAPALFDPVEAAQEDTRPRIVWEYRTADGWAALEVRDETEGLARPGLLTFVGPVDLVSAAELGTTAHWLRARAVAEPPTPAPRLRRVLTNTTWAAEATSIRDEVLGSSTGEPSQRFRTAHAPVLPGERLEIYEADAWVEWLEVRDFYASGPQSRHYVLDRLAGTIDFGDGRRGLVPPVGRANVRMSTYRTGGGPRGNRSVGALAQLKTSVPYVKGVHNPDPATGGAAAETLDDARRRGPKTLRHRGRAVAAADVEDLAFEATPEVARAYAIPARDATTAGTVGLVVVPQGPEAQPVPSVELIRRVDDFVRARLDVTADLVVTGPGWIRVDVRSDVVPVSVEQASDVESGARARLSAFLHPLTGGVDGTGWPFGRRPHRSDLYAVLETVDGVDHVRSLELDESDTSPSPAPDAFLVFSGTHTISVRGDE